MVVLRKMKCMQNLLRTSQNTLYCTGEHILIKTMHFLCGIQKCKSKKVSIMDKKSNLLMKRQVPSSIGYIDLSETLRKGRILPKSFFGE